MPIGPNGEHLLPIHCPDRVATAWPGGVGLCAVQHMEGVAELKQMSSAITDGETEDP